MERFGKLQPRLLEEIVFSNLGATNEAVLVGPKNGFDNAIVSLGDRRRLILTSDPLSIIPSIGMKESARLSLHLLASDFTTTGLKPQFAVFDFNLPSELSTRHLEAYFKALGDECKRLGIAIVAGHTGRYPGAGFTVVGGGVLFGDCEEGEYLTPAMAEEGDKILITKGAAIETTAILASTFPNVVRRSLGGEVLRRARKRLSHCSTVRDALTVASTGLKTAVTSMHDATEGGVLGGLHEHAVASGRSFLVDIGRIFVPEEVRKVCSLFGLNPLLSLSEGTLIITCRPDAVDKIEDRLGRAAIRIFEVGRVGGGDGNGVLLRSDEAGARRFTPPSRDPYWAAYAAAIRRGWS